ncbi:MAG: hypothetical protein HC903_02295 [Methylacidiphilales bacterium]|nr:hypothetical protein [Candidatus Methylacidiphilales bacterium]NJR16706.1 hypothetical protein [Calothrix sp. CSU_2_0]
MIISDLNYLETVDKASHLEGGGDVLQGVTIPLQLGVAGVGGAGRNSIGNTAIALNIAIPTLTGIGIL